MQGSAHQRQPRRREGQFRLVERATPEGQNVSEDKNIPLSASRERQLECSGERLPVQLSLTPLDSSTFHRLSEGAAEAE